VARAFFIWVSVFNLFIVSVFWSFMADLFSNAQARRLFGVIAAGGSIGAIAGPALTAGLSAQIGTANLLLISMGFLVFSLLCIYALLRWERYTAATAVDGVAADKEAAIHGGILEGATRVLRSPYLLAICLFVLFYTSLSTFLYFEQAHIVRAAFDDSAKRTALFAGIDLAVNTLTVLAQLFVTSRLIGRLGLGTTLAVVPLGLAVGFLVLAVQPVLAVLVALQVLRRAGNYAFTRPGREILFTVLPRTDKYKSKNFIDTVVYRGGDALSAWAFAGLAGLGLGLSAIAWLAVPLALLWAGLGVWLGRRQEILRDAQPTAELATASIVQRE
jgi:AAA family ATP:ADP antiporter